MSRPATELLEEGEAAFGRGDLTGAERLFRAVLKRDPTNAPALNDLAVVLHATGRVEEAEAAFLRACIFDPEDAYPLVNLVAIAREAGRLTEAAAYLKCALSRGADPATLRDEMAALRQATAPDAVPARLREAIPPSGYRAAFAEVDITPLVSDGACALQGLFTPTPRLATGVDAPLKMQLLLLEDVDGARAFIVSADIFAFDPAMVEGVRVHAARHQLAPEAVLLNASHTHYGPGTFGRALPGLGRLDRPYAERLTELIGHALPKLEAALAPAGLAWTRTRAQIGFSRRTSVRGSVVMVPNPEAYYERETPILVVHRADGGLCVLVNHGCHPTGLAKSTAISPDFVGAFRDRLAESLGEAATGMFLQGAAGDIKHGFLLNDVPQWSADPGATADVGARLARAVYGALEGGVSPVTGPIRARRARIRAPLRPRPPVAQVFSDPANAHVGRAMLNEWAAHVSGTWPEAPPAHLESTLYGLTIGSVGLCAFTGEPVAALAGRIRERAGHEVVFVLGYTNGVDAYFPTDAMVREGGYEAYRSHFVYLLPSAFAEGVEGAVLDAVDAALGVEG